MILETVVDCYGDIYKVIDIIELKRNNWIQSQGGKGATANVATLQAVQLRVPG